MSDLNADFLRATRASYDAFAKEYTAEHPASLSYPLDLALLTAFAQLVAVNSAAPVADVGSGPGYVTARLAGLGVPAFGVDLSPAMVALARAAHPGLRFHVGSMTSLDLPGVFAEFHRTLVPGGHVLLAFQSRTAEPRLHLTERYGHPVDLDYHLRTPPEITAHATAAGLDPVASLLREPQGEESRARGFVLARKPGAAT